MRVESGWYQSNLACEWRMNARASELQLAWWRCWRGWRCLSNLSWHCALLANSGLCPNSHSYCNTCWGNYGRVFLFLVVSDHGPHGQMGVHSCWSSFLARIVQEVTCAWSSSESVFYDILATFLISFWSTIYIHKVTTWDLSQEKCLSCPSTHMYF